MCGVGALGDGRHQTFQLALIRIPYELVHFVKHEILDAAEVHFPTVQHKVVQPAWSSHHHLGAALELLQLILGVSTAQQHGAPKTSPFQHHATHLGDLRDQFPPGRHNEELGTPPPPLHTSPIAIDIGGIGGSRCPMLIQHALEQRQEVCECLAGSRVCVYDEVVALQNAWDGLDLRVGGVEDAATPQVLHHHGVADADVRVGEPPLLLGVDVTQLGEVKHTVVAGNTTALLWRPRARLTLVGHRGIRPALQLFSGSQGRLDEVVAGALHPTQALI
mmetsp:Transcript_13251/g.38243  ORF Transcript_13251/g.38243 Transcript_13251/m.38243 type:complete len:276 (-) Transcript_13251:922-1749(-)